MLEAQSHWQSADEDAAMQEEHEFIWRAMLATIDVELPGRRVLDAGLIGGPAHPGSFGCWRARPGSPRDTATTRPRPRSPTLAGLRAMSR
jgi:hypothetical protein